MAQNHADNASLLKALASLPEPSRTALAVQLRRINAKKLKRQLDGDSCLRKAFDAVVYRLHHDGAPLSEVTFARAEGILFDVAIALGWYTLEDAQKDSFFWDRPSFNYRNPPPIPAPTARLGSYLVQDVFVGRFQEVLEGAKEGWRAMALERAAGVAPAPPTTPPPRATPGERIPWPEKYPTSLPDKSCDNLEAEEILAKREFDQACRQNPYGIREHLRAYTLRMLLMFAQEARDHRLWPVTEMGEYCLEYLRKVTIWADHSENMNIISHVTGSLELGWVRFLKESDLWRKYEDVLLEVADPQATGASAAPAAEPEDASGASHESTAGPAEAQTQAGGPGGVPEPGTEQTAPKSRVGRPAGVRIDGPRLRKLREKITPFVSQTDFGDKCNPPLSEDTVQRAERGDSMDPRTADILVSVLVDLGYSRSIAESIKKPQ